MPRIADPQVAEAFRAFPKAARIRLLALRETIHAVAAATPGVGRCMRR